MKRHPLFVCAAVLSPLLSACVAQGAPIDPFAADKPIGPVRPAPYEPKSGAYTGAALDTSAMRGNTEKALTAQMTDFNQMGGKKQALYLHFIQFPNQSGGFGTWERDANGWVSASDFVNACSNVGATPILTLEPFAPRVFLDWRPGSKAYEATKAFAQSAGAWKKPIFIRFAHEMNGSWYPWAEWNDLNRNVVRDPNENTGFTPDNYKTAYRNVASMFRQYAPNAALIWCPNSGLLGGPQRDVFRPWYPGDDVVDWVGFDVYERGWNLPRPGAHLWGGLFGYNLTHDMTDNPATPVNESVNFYQLYAQWKRKPIMICETSSTLSFRTDLTPQQRTDLTRDWKIGYWNSNEYGWMQSVYGTSTTPGMKFLEPIDQKFPMIKAVVWFQIGKREFVSGEKSPGNYVWFQNEWTDYRIGGGAQEGVPSPYSQQEIDVYRSLVSRPYFLSQVQNVNIPVPAKTKIAARAKN